MPAQQRLRRNQVEAADVIAGGGDAPTSSSSSCSSSYFDACLSVFERAAAVPQHRHQLPSPSATKVMKEAKNVAIEEEDQREVATISGALVTPALPAAATTSRKDLDTKQMKQKLFNSSLLTPRRDNNNVATTSSPSSSSAITTKATAASSTSTSTSNKIRGQIIQQQRQQKQKQQQQADDVDDDDDNDDDEEEDEDEEGDEENDGDCRRHHRSPHRHSNSKEHIITNADRILADLELRLQRRLLSKYNDNDSNDADDVCGDKMVPGDRRRQSTSSITSSIEEPIDHTNTTNTDTTTGVSSSKWGGVGSNNKSNTLRHHSHRDDIGRMTINDVQALLEEEIEHHRRHYASFEYDPINPSSTEEEPLNANVDDDNGFGGSSEKESDNKTKNTNKTNRSAPPALSLTVAVDDSAAGAGAGAGAGVKMNTITDCECCGLRPDVADVRCVEPLTDVPFPRRFYPISLGLQNEVDLMDRLWDIVANADFSKVGVGCPPSTANATATSTSSGSSPPSSSSPPCKSNNDHREQHHTSVSFATSSASPENPPAITTTGDGLVESDGDGDDNVPVDDDIDDVADLDASTAARKREQDQDQKKKQEQEERERERRSVLLKQHFEQRVGAAPWAEYFFRRTRQQVQAVQRDAAHKELMQRRLAHLEQVYDDMRIEAQIIKQCLKLSIPEERLLEVYQQRIKTVSSTKDVETVRKYHDSRIEKLELWNARLLEKFTVSLEEIRRGMALVHHLAAQAEQRGLPLARERLVKVVHAILEFSPTAAVSEDMERSIEEHLEKVAEHTDFSSPSSVGKGSVVARTFSSLIDVTIRGRFVDPTHSMDAICPDCFMPRRFSTFCMMTGKLHITASTVAAAAAAATTTVPTLASSTTGGNKTDPKAIEDDGGNKDNMNDPKSVETVVKARGGSGGGGRVKKTNNNLFKAMGKSLIEGLKSTKVAAAVQQKKPPEQQKQKGAAEGQGKGSGSGSGTANAAAAAPSAASSKREIKFDDTVNNNSVGEHVQPPATTASSFEASADQSTTVNKPSVMATTSPATIRKVKKPSNQRVAAAGRNKKSSSAAAASGGGARHQLSPSSRNPPQHDTVPGDDSVNFSGNAIVLNNEKISRHQLLADAYDAYSGSWRLDYFGRLAFEPDGTAAANAAAAVAGGKGTRTAGAGATNEQQMLIKDSKTTKMGGVQEEEEDGDTPDVADPTIPHQPQQRRLTEIESWEEGFIWRNMKEYLEAVTARDVGKMQNTQDDLLGFMASLQKRQNQNNNAEKQQAHGGMSSWAVGSTVDPTSGAGTAGTGGSRREVGGNDNARKKSLLPSKKKLLALGNAAIATTGSSRRGSSIGNDGANTSSEEERSTQQDAPFFDEWGNESRNNGDSGKRDGSVAPMMSHHQDMGSASTLRAITGNVAAAEKREEALRQEVLKSNVLCQMQASFTRHFGRLNEIYRAQQEATLFGPEQREAELQSMQKALKSLKKRFTQRSAEEKKEVDDDRFKHLVMHFSGLNDQLTQQKDKLFVINKENEELQRELEGILSEVETLGKEDGGGGDDTEDEDPEDNQVEEGGGPGKVNAAYGVHPDLHQREKKEDGTEGGVGVRVGAASKTHLSGARERKVQLLVDDD